MLHRRLGGKSKDEESHFKDMEKVFERCRRYSLQMNPLKCAFGMTLGKLLGCVVHQHGVDPDR